jgi:ribosome-binding protein aMBF1 (putative translation factor)
MNYQEEKNKLAVRCGLHVADINEYGEQEYLGSDKAWKEFEKELEILDNADLEESDLGDEE